MDENTSNQSSKNTLVIGGIVLAAIIVVGAVVFINTNRSSTTPTTSFASTPKPNDSESMMAEGSTETESDMVEGDTQVVKIEAGSFYYKPDTITVKKGQKVRLEMTSVDMMHDFNIDELGVKIPVTQSGNTATVEFTADEVGSFEFYCAVGNHKAQGQVGTLIVQ